MNKQDPDMSSVINKLIDGLQTITPVIQDMTTTIAEMKVEIKNLEKTVNSLAHIVRDGNGQKPLTTRIAVLETEVEDLKHEEKEESKEKMIRKSIMSKLIIALISGALGIGATLLGWYLNGGF